MDENELSKHIDEIEAGIEDAVLIGALSLKQAAHMRFLITEIRRLRQVNSIILEALEAISNNTAYQYAEQHGIPRSSDFSRLLKSVARYALGHVEDLD